MRRVALLLIVVLAVFAASSCSKGLTGPDPAYVPVTENDPADPMHAKFAGTWQAVKAEVFNSESPAQTRDLTAEGWSIILVLNADGTYAVTLTVPGASPAADTGYWGPSTDSKNMELYFYPASIPDIGYGEFPPFAAALDGNNLTLKQGPAHIIPYDFGWSNGPRSYNVRLCLVLTRQ